MAGGRIGAWAGWRPSPLVVDAAIAIVCYLATIALPVKAAAMVGWQLYVLAALASMPLVWRRRYPAEVAAVVGVGTIGMSAWGYQHYIPLPYGQLVATYTVAVLATAAYRLVVMVITTVAVVVAVTGLLGQQPSIVGTALLPFAFAYALGVGARARHDRIAMLEERAARVAEERQAAAVREREQIAREIHDIVAHSVSLMVVQAEAGTVLAADTDKAQAVFDTISATGREAVAQLDRALGVLRGDDAGRHPQPGLSDLPSLLAQARSAGLAAELVVHGEPSDVPADFATAVYRLVQEALTNTLRHANAANATVVLDWRPGELQLRMTDDGRGPVPGPGGHGLIGMAERARAFGGSLGTGPSDTGRGFRVEATLPLPGLTDG